MPLGICSLAAEVHDWDQEGWWFKTPVQPQ